MSSISLNKREPEELGPSDFQGTILKKTNDCAMILFYAHWCGFCKAMKPEWIKFYQMLPQLKIYSIDFGKEENKNLVQEFQKAGLVPGYPTVLLYRNGMPIETYSGDRRAQAFLEYGSGKCRA